LSDGWSPAKVQHRVGDLVSFRRDACLILVGKPLNRDADEIVLR